MAHIYVTDPKTVPIEQMRVLGESVVQSGTGHRDQRLCTGSLPPLPSFD